MTGHEWQNLEPVLHAEQLEIGGRAVRRGDRVRLRPKRGGDVMDAALAGRTGVIESVEQDFEGKYHCVVVVDDDPGSDMGLQRMPGHRFFFAPDEIELLDNADDGVADGAPSILVAGIGNIFLGDDAFGVEVVRRLIQLRLPRNVTVTDFGIRGYDLAYALLAEPDRTILIDACPRGGEPGTVYVIEPDLGELNNDGGAGLLDGHGMHPMNVLRLARSLGGKLAGIVLVGCEPATFGPPEGLMGLSEPIEAAVAGAVKVVESLIAEYSEPRMNPVAARIPN